MKRIVAIILVIALIAALSVSLFSCVKRSEKLRLYMPGEYIDEDLFEEFEDWYKEKTGKKVRVEIETFDTVENARLAVETKGDFDLVCPSDYAIEYLIKKGLVQKVDKNIINVKDVIRQEYLDTSEAFDPTLEYSVPYMYGTLGIVYDITKTGKKITSWDSLFGSEFNGKRSIKDSERDAYAAACLYNKRNELLALSGAEKKAAVQAVFQDATDETVAAAKQTLLSVKDGSVWDVDNVKYEMAANSTDVAVALMWSCDAGYVMNDYEDVNGDMQKGNRNLWYVVPDEGGNIYIDAFVISAYAKNVEAANWFLKFLCEKDTAIANSEYAGAISPVAAAYDELLERYKKDDELFAGTAEGWKDMFIETMFPSEETRNRCGVMKDFGGNSAVTKM